MVVQSLAPMFVERKTADANWQTHLDPPDCPLRLMQWYWGRDLLTGFEQWFWVGPEVLPQDMPNYLADERPARGSVYPCDSRQGVSYGADRGF